MSASLTSRRGFLGVAASVAAGLLVPKGAFAQPLSPRLLRFDHLHTGEKLAIEYWKGGTYEPQSLDAINHLMRDFRTGDVYPIDPPFSIFSMISRRQPGPAAPSRSSRPIAHPRRTPSSTSTAT